MAGPQVTVEELFKLSTRRSVVALLSAAMTGCAFASFVSAMFVVNRRCWVVPCARRSHGPHAELLGLKVRAGDAFSCVSSTACALCYAWASFRMFGVEGTLATAANKFAAYKGLTLGMVLVLFQQTVMWIEEAGTVGTFIHRGAARLNANNDGGTDPGGSSHGGIPNVYLLHAMQSLAIFVVLTFLLGAGIAWCVFNWENDLVASNEYEAIPSSDTVNSTEGQESISIPVIESPTLQRRMAAKRRKEKAKRMKKKKKARKEGSRGRSTTNDSLGDVDSEEDFGHLEKELELGHGSAELEAEDEVGAVDL